MDAQNLTVADLMTIDPIVVAVDAPIEDAAALFRSKEVTGLPVIDDRGDLVGVISQSDLVALAESALGRRVRGEASGLRVGELMSSPAITVPMTARAGDGARLMLDRHIHRVVALDDAGHPIGVLSATDFVRLFADD